MLKPIPSYDDIWKEILSDLYGHEGRVPTMESGSLLNKKQKNAVRSLAPSALWGHRPGSKPSPNQPQS